MKWTARTFGFGLAAWIMVAVGQTFAGPATDYGLFNSGVDDSEVVLTDNDPDPHYEMIEPSQVLGAPFVATSAGGFPIGPWLADNHLSAWLTPSESTAGPGDFDGEPSYIFRTTFDLTGVPTDTLFIDGQWSSDNTGLDILLNGQSLGFRNDVQFGGWSPFTLDSFFQDGTNTVDFVINNGGNEDNSDGPAGVRIEFDGNGGAPPPPAPPHPHAIPSLFPTGVDDFGQALADDNAPDPHYTIVLDPADEAQEAVTVPNDGFPIPPWFANDSDSRWISPPDIIDADDAMGEPGLYVYQTTFNMSGRDVDNAVIVGSRGTDDAGPTILLNGVEVPVAPSRGFAERSWFGISSASAKEAGTEILPGDNTLSFVVENGGEDINPTGLRVDDLFARAAPEGSTPIPGLFSTGVDDDNLPLADFDEDPHYEMTVAPDDATQPATALGGPPSPPWAENSGSSRWIGPNDSPAGEGPPGDYEFTIEFDMADLDPSSAVIMGMWSADNSGSDILLNGVATDNAQRGGFPVLSSFEISAERGDGFLPGVNTLTFLLNNAGEDFNPAGLRVEGLVAFARTGGLLGDFNGNGMLDIGDIDDLTVQTAGGTNPSPYDLNSDSLVDSADINVWIRDLFNSWIGDANLDGQFNSADLVVVLASGSYEADVDAVWSSGDFNGDGRTNSSDLVVALSDGGYENGERPAVSAVPEPSTIVLALFGMLGIGGTRRRRA